MHLHITDTEKGQDQELQSQGGDWEGREETQEWSDHFGFYEVDLKEVEGMNSGTTVYEGTVTIDGRIYHIRVGNKDDMFL